MSKIEAKCFLNIKFKLDSIPDYYRNIIAINQDETEANYYPALKTTQKMIIIEPKDTDFTEYGYKYLADIINEQIKSVPINTFSDFDDVKLEIPLLNSNSNIDVAMINELGYSRYKPISECSVDEFQDYIMEIMNKAGLK